jgi:hypothetical protein
VHSDADEVQWRTYGKERRGATGARKRWEGMLWRGTVVCAWQGGKRRSMRAEASEKGQYSMAQQCACGRETTESIESQEKHQECGGERMDTDARHSSTCMVGRHEGKLQGREMWEMVV